MARKFNRWELSRWKKPSAITSVRLSSRLVGLSLAPMALQLVSESSGPRSTFVCKSSASLAPARNPLRQNRISARRARDLGTTVHLHTPQCLQEESRNRLSFEVAQGWCELLLRVLN